MRQMLAFLLLMSLAVPAYATYRAINLLNVVPIDQNTFEVIEDRGAGASDIWCAAADYARAAGLDGLRKRMYVLDVRGQSKTTANAVGIVFTLDPSEDIRNTAPSYSVTVTRKGENLPISHAFDFCNDVRFDTLKNF